MTIGQQVVEAIRAYLKTTGKRLRDLDAATVEQIVDGAGIGRQPKARSSTKPDDEWLANLKEDPAFEGIDIDAQLAKARFWCGQNGRQCTRRFFSNWLLKADKPILSQSGPPTHTESRPASLGALQMQLKRVELELDDIWYPGGCSFKQVPTGDKRTRSDELLAQRAEIKRRMDDYGGPRRELREMESPISLGEAL